MTRIGLALVALALSRCGAPESSPPSDPGPAPEAWSVEASVGSASVMLGEDFELTLTVRHPAGGALVAPPAAELAPFEVLESVQDTTSPYETRLRYRMAAYELPGTLDVPALELGYRDASGELGSLRTEAIPIEVLSSLTEERTEIHDIKEPVPLEVPRSARPFVWAALGALLAAAAFLGYRRWWRPGVGAEEAPLPVPLEPPDVEAERALHELVERRLIEKGELERFYVELTGIMKRYAGRRFHVAYLERTTGEILADLRRRGVSHPALEPILDASDRVKFARARPADEEAREALVRARELVRDTRPARDPAGAAATTAREATTRS